MSGLLFVIASFGVTILAWGLYGPTLHEGQHAMSTVGGYARLRPFVCVGLAYFLIGVIVPAVILWTRGEKGAWTARGALMSLFGGALGAIGALGIIMAFTFGGKPSFVMPLVFGGAPVVNSFLTIYWAKRMKEIGPIFMAGLVMVVLGAVTVLVFKPSAPKPAPAAVAVEAADTETTQTLTEEAATEIKQAGVWGGDFLMQILSIATVVCCWGTYGPVLHHGQSAMQHSRLRPLLCVGLAYFAIAVVVPWLLLSGPLPEASEYNFAGSAWSLGAGAAGAIGALGIIMAFNFGGRPVYVMPLVFGGAPVVNTFATIIAKGQMSLVSPMFLAGLILVIAGAAMVLVFAPKGPPPKKAPAEKNGPAPEAKPEPLGDASGAPSDD